MIQRFYCNIIKKVLFLSFMAGVLLLTNVQIYAQKPIQRKGGSYVKVALQTYSFNKMLNDNAKGRGVGISLYDILNFCADNNFDAVDLTGYYFPDYPIAPSDEYIFDIKRRAFELGIDICGTGVKNDFADPDPAKRAADVKLVKAWVDVAVKLGAPQVRIFSGNIPVGYENKWDEIAKYMAVCIKECADYGKERGVMIAVQNHGDFLKTADETIKLVKLVNSDWFSVIVDTGYFITDDPYVDMAKVMPYATTFLLKQSPIPLGSPIKIDLKRIMKIVKESGFRGYLPIETLAIREPKGSPQSTINKPSYDPYKVVPLFLKEVRAAAKAEYEN